MDHCWSVWLLPETKDMETFRAYIETYSRLYATNLFDPHVTLFGRLDIDPESTFSFFNALSSEPGIEKIKNLYIQSGEQPWKTVHIKLDRDTRLLTLQKKIHKQFARFRNYRFDPHLSLAYGNFIPDKRDIDLISIKKSISFSSLAIMHTPDQIEDWRLIKKFNFS